MSFDQTPLWNTAFKTMRNDATTQEQAQLAECYLSMRKRASALVSRIAADLPHMTIHDVTHLDALWEMASVACGDRVTLNPAEAFVFGGAVLLHDAAMALAAFPGGLTDLKQTTEWCDLHARHSAELKENTPEIAMEIEKRTTEDALRLLHAKQAEALPKVSWNGPHGEPMYVIEDPQVRSFYGPKIGRIAHSHWWSISKVEEELSGTLGALAGVTNSTVDLLKVACMLRVADAMHLDQRRAPAFQFALAQPSGISADHWRFQERMAKPFVQGDALVYTAQPPFEVELADAWWTAFDALQVVDRELRNVDRVLRERQKPPLIVRRVDGVHSPTELARTVETDGWTPVDSTVRVSDVPKIINSLGGSKLYGDNSRAPIRELIQNGLDAITARRRLQSRPTDWGQLQVRIEQRNDDHWLCVEDNGVGMSISVLTGPLIDFGNSFWRSSLAIQELPGLASKGMKARGRYGIGFFSVFMLGDHVKVITRRYDRDLRSAKVLEFRHGLNSRPNLRDAALQEVPVDGGTTVEVRLRGSPVEPGGMLYQKNLFIGGTLLTLAEVVASIAPATDVAIRTSEYGKAVECSQPGDWLEISGDALISRIAPKFTRTARPRKSFKLAEIRDEAGNVFGRARISLDSAPWSEPTGCIVVGGLTANRINLFAGILLGVETTASRNSARPTVPTSVLAKWASEQATTIISADLPEEDKARAGEIVMACGGDHGELPIVKWMGRWMSASAFSEAIEDHEDFVIHSGEFSHDDDDDVTRRAFNESFQPDPMVAHTRGDGSIGMTGWIANVMQGQGASPQLLLEEILLSSWGDISKMEDDRVVGKVNGSEIYRNVTVYSRPNSHENDGET